MKTIFQLLIFLCSSAAIAQSDSISVYFGVYTNTDKSVTYLFTEGINHTTSMELLRKTDKNPNNVEDGRVGKPDKGRYPMMVTVSGERVYYWIDFKTDSNGTKSAVISTKTEAIDTLWFSDDQSWYQEYLDYMSDESDFDEDGSEETDEEAYNITGYQREDGAILILNFPVDSADKSGTSFTLIGAPEESCFDENSIEGILTQIDGKNYSFKTGDCTLLLTIEEDGVTIGEEKCKTLHAKGCKNWAGVYMLDM